MKEQKTKQKNPSHLMCKPAGKKKTTGKKKKKKKEGRLLRFPHFYVYPLISLKAEITVHLSLGWRKIWAQKWVKGAQNGLWSVNTKALAKRLPGG